jgi:lysine-N-methylase
VNFPIRQLPTIQNWSCHQCGNCCREYYVSVTDEEKQRIEQQGWAARPEFQGTPLFAWYAGPPWRKEYRLTHRADGSCIFLDERGLCRIHGEFGEPAKPIACQLYPYMLVPAGNEMRVSVRFSCPSVVKNLGRPVAEQGDAIRRYAKELIPRAARPPKPPPVWRNRFLEWPDLMQVIETFERMVAGAGVDLPRRMIQAVALARLLAETRFDNVQGRKLRDLLDILGEAATSACPPDLNTVGDCTPWSLKLFRLIVAQCARKDLSPHLRQGLRGRWGLFRAALSFSRGRGPIPRLQPIFGDVTFESVEQPFGEFPPDAAAILERYYRIKLTGLQFFGAAFYRVSLVEGFYGLALTLPTIVWIARWLAAGAGRQTLSTDDVCLALTVVDHQWGFAQVLGFRYSRSRVRLLASQGQIERLITRYWR